MDLPSALIKLTVIPIDDGSQTPEQAVGPAITNLHNAIIGFISGVEGLILEIGGGLVVLMLIVAGFHYITGNAKQGKTAISAAIIGLIIMILSYSIIRFVCTAGGISC